MSNYYIYVYLDPRKVGKYCYSDVCFTFEPFYVGKGSNGRWKEIHGRTDYFKNKINKIKQSGLEPIVFKLCENLSESKSFEFERQLIKEIGRYDLKKGTLINLTNGGEGSSGTIISEKTRIKLSEKNKGENNSFFGKHHSEKILKKRRKNFQEIKEEFERKGYKLLTEENEYKNCYTKLNYTCQKGHKSFIIWNSFQQDHGCPYCAKLKINFSDIKHEFEKRNYVLLTEEKDYKNNKTKLKYICFNEHKGSIRWNDFQQGKGCVLCAKNRRKNFQEIEGEFEKRNYKLLSEEKIYITSDSKLEYINKFGEIKLISWHHFQQKYKIII